MESPLISIIVPIYNVEEYIDECISSIINQTYRNLEIILVDDGSPDNCPGICERWASKDERILVIHKINGGLSSARNAGLECASGDFIGFVDGDDIIMPDMFESLLESFDDDIAITGGMVMVVDNNKRYAYTKQQLIKKETYTKGNDFFLKVLDSIICGTVWNKLYRAKLIKDLRFLEGRNNEDLLFLFEVSKKLEKSNQNVLDITKYVYLYRQRSNSICTNLKTPLHIDALLNLKYIHEYYIKNNDKRAAEVKFQYTNRLLNFNGDILINKTWKKQYGEKYKNELDKISDGYFISEFFKRKNYKRMVAFILIRYFPNTYTRLFKAFH